MGRHQILADMQAIPLRPPQPRVLTLSKTWSCESLRPLPPEPVLHLHANDTDWCDMLDLRDHLEVECGNRVEAAWKGDFGAAVASELAIKELSAELAAKLTAFGAAENAAHAWVAYLCRAVMLYWRRDNDDRSEADD